MTVDVICPYCNCAIDEAQESVQACAACGTRHHAECWQDNNGCTVYGCTAAPPDEPKLTVQTTDFARPAVQPTPMFMGQPVPQPVTANYAPPPPPPRPVPPPPPASTSYAPPPPPPWQVPAPPPAATGYAPPPAPYAPPPPPPPQYAPQMTFGGYAVPAPPVPPPMAFHPPMQVRSKSRTTFILLGIFLGAFGAHNFYAGYKGRAIAQLAITICTVFICSIISWIWAIVEVCIVDRDARGISMT
jgi:TM2 domain-containing membrane protein YozV